VDHHGALGRLELFLHSPVEGQDGCGIVRHPMIRPGREVELSHLQSSLRATKKLQQAFNNNFSVPQEAYE